MYFISFLKAKTPKNSGRRLGAPKAVCNVEEVRGYWEPEQINSNSSNFSATYFPKFPNSQFAGN